MGEIRKVLAMDEIEPRTITSNMIWSDLCEDIHLHFRNVRFDFSETEWAGFRAAIHQLGLSVEEESLARDYEEGDPNRLIQLMYNVPLKSDSKYYPNRCVIELQKDNTVHFHYRDLRLHWTISEFKAIATLFRKAFVELRSLSMNPFPYRDVKELTYAVVPIEMIQPYDAGHRPLAIDDEHRKGIEHIKKLIKAGARIRPILVSSRGQRLDGFKRYMAFLELGHPTVECFVDPFGQMGGQGHKSLELSEEEANELHI